MKDAVATMGALLPEDAAGRDAVHVAVFSARAPVKLFPGQDVGLVDAEAVEHGDMVVSPYCDRGGGGGRKLMRKIIQMFESDGDACALASDGTLWWWRPYGTGQAPGWQPWADGLPQPEDTPDPATILARMAEALKQVEDIGLFEAHHADVEQKRQEATLITAVNKSISEALAEYERLVNELSK